MNEALGGLSLGQPSAPAAEATPTRFKTLSPDKQNTLQRMLYEAVRCGYPAAVSRLLEAGVPFDEQDSTDEVKAYTRNGSAFVTVLTWPT